VAGDFADLRCEIERLTAAGADYIHLDVMDGHFVPNITIGAPVVKDLRKTTALPLDAHLMITHPLQYIDDFAKAGADIITVHLESEGDTAQALKKIRTHHIIPALAIKPGTPAEQALSLLPLVGMVLVMTVEPGFSGQAFMPDMLPKIRAIRDEITRRDLPVGIQVDGGINAQTAREAVAAGANILVAGNYLFGADDVAAAIAALRA